MTLLKNTSSKLICLAIASIFLSIATTAQSALDVSITKKKTSISIYNFPKNATVLLVDDNLNLLSIASTNEKGMALVTLDKAVKSIIFARTVHGDIEASSKNKKVLKEENPIVSNKVKRTIKA